MPSAGQGASALSPSQRRRGLTAPASILPVAAVVLALTQAAVAPAVTSPHAAATAPSATSTTLADTGLAALRIAAASAATSAATSTSTTTTTSLPAPIPATTSTTTGLPPAPRAMSPAATSPALPARGQATAWGCGAALEYLHAYAAPGFTLECPGDAEGHQGMTCDDEPGSCPNSAVIAIADPCPQTYMNEASNSWVLTGRSNAPIDPYGPCP